MKQVWLEIKGQFGLNTLAFALLVGGLAFINAKLLESEQDLAFYMGAAVGTAVYLSWMRPRKLHGFGLSIASITWCYLVVSSGTLNRVFS